ncbi:sigma 54-interacting transcriptional regulator [Mesorhizobium muleiense]|uniref:sigma 54-interacting transcriptional regulator n=1 Tax=Mesorhizobium muleiense TaxID=1004279 RepID=UPI003AFAFC8B
MKPSGGTEIVYKSASQHALLEKLAKVASTSAEVLITGPSGVGKELYAVYTHNNSRRCDRPFIAVNCSNLSSHLLENEVFGHARGAYTGANTSMGGIVAAAEGGSLFLDEVDTLPAASQAKLLRFIQTREYRRLGETSLRRADIRLIAASNADLEQQVRDGHFRSDLYYRLRVVPIEVAPLSERPDDIEPLLDYFVALYAGEYCLPKIRFNAASMRRIMSYAWPGNVRELENCVRYLTCLQLERLVEPRDLELNPDNQTCKQEGSRAAPPAPHSEDFGEAPDRAANGQQPPRAAASSSEAIIDEPLREAKQKVIVSFERDYIERALGRANGNISEAARASGKHRRAFFELMRKHGFDSVDFRHDG